MAHKREISFYIAFTILSTINGCGSEPTIKVELWEPTTQQVRAAVEVASVYAHEQLNVSRDQLDRMKTKSAAWSVDRRKTIRLEFYDPTHFPDWETMGGVLGGFPYYFAATVDASSWTVVDHYASRE
jgi:hypothetical protein